jgi:2-oxoglutarate dehydrogenase E1 component
VDKYSYLNNANGAFVEELYEQYLADPQSVEPGWQRFFEGYEFGAARADASPSQGGGLSDPDDVTRVEIAAMKYINAFRDRGHLISNTNPVRVRRYHKADLDLDYFGLQDVDLDVELEVGRQIRIGRAKFRDVMAHLHETYCSSIGVEYRYIPDSRIRMWLHEQMESTANKPNYDKEKRVQILRKLGQAVGFENFLHVKYVGQKRFSLEGCESFIPALDAVFRQGAALGVEEFVMGMAHRGRLNVLVNLFGKTYESVFSEFEGGILPTQVHGDGDVKYHMGHAADFTAPNGNNVHLSLLANPSHLEAVDPLVLGQARAKGTAMFDGDFKKICPVMVHGDAAFAGQGVVYEIANLSRLEGYATGGTVHVVINNQVGFTANYRETRSSLYCTDIAKVTECPVFHVNGDDPEACTHVAEMAMKLRQEFGIDVFIDIVCYRRYGHNEGDDPRFTQPLLYKAIENKPSALDIYADRLIRDGVITDAEAKRLSHEFNEELQESLVSARESKNGGEKKRFTDYLGRQWGGFRRSNAKDFEKSSPTGVSKRKLDRYAEALDTVPEDFHIYPKLRRLLDQRRSLYDDGKVNWGLAEQLAYGSLLCDGKPVRLSGQDARRGTFAHRHAVLIDYRDETEHVLLNHIKPDQAKFEVYNSHLSEYGVMGFEYGYALSSPNSLILWEGQFGDFANGAQIIIDQFLSSAESKWQRMCGLVLLLPHGYEGQGPEHSSARFERYLELCAEDNMIVCNPTTPANLFHLLRRQVQVKYRKPLIVMTPKSLLRHPECISEVSELVEGRFRETLDVDNTEPKGLKRVVLCTGKIYYELLARRREGGHDDLALVRLEQLYPIPRRQDAELVEKYRDVEDWVWVQEEPENMGAWRHVRDRFEALRPLRVISRRESASPATGSLYRHRKVQTRIINEAVEGL